MQRENWLLVIRVSFWGVININLSKVHELFDVYECEVLTSHIENKELIKGFVSAKEGDSLESYLKDPAKAWKEDSDGETRVYIIKDKSIKGATNIACYFSLKCGLLVGDKIEEKLSEEELALLEPYIEAKRKNDGNAAQNMFDAINSFFPNRADTLFAIASERLNRKTEALQIGQSENTINVPLCFSAIELRHFCRNASYRSTQKLNIPLGFGLFWEKIVPVILDISDRIGSKYVYLFAADKTYNGMEVGTKSLINHYKENLKFHECDNVIKFVKPDYDHWCYGLIQEISELRANKEAIWEQFSDVLEEGLPGN